MRKESLILFIIVTNLIVLISCSREKGCTDSNALNYDESAKKDDGSCLFSNILNSNLDYGSVTDQDGNTYATIHIGTQTWMAENLKTSIYCDGSPIARVADNQQWSNFTSGAWSHFNNDNEHEEPYGKLYNWYAVNDSRNICPCGWRVPSVSDWNTLMNFLDPNATSDNNSSNIAGRKMKSEGSVYWRSSNTATNESGFSGLPGGFRRPNGEFSHLKQNGLWWSSSAENRWEVYAYSMYYGSDAVLTLTRSKEFGYSVRCIKN